jgi:hypothetical protein
VAYVGRREIRPAGYSAALVPVDTAPGLRPPPLPRSAEHPTELIGTGGVCPRLGVLALRGTYVREAALLILGAEDDWREHGDYPAL